MKDDALLDEGLMSIAQAAEFMSVSQQSVWRMIWTNQLPYTYLGRSRRIPRAAVKALISKRLVVPL